MKIIRRNTLAALSSNHKIALANLPQPTIIDYFTNEIKRDYFVENDERYEERREKFYCFLQVPKELEKFIWFGFLQSIDAFAAMFTLLPLRFILTFWNFCLRVMYRLIIFIKVQSFNIQFEPLLKPSEICDLFKGFIIIFTTFFVLLFVDTSMFYHIIKSQSVIKLCIFFNMLDLAEKLMTSFGLDVLDTLYWSATDNQKKKPEYWGFIPHLIFAFIYVFAHTILVLLQATTLNVSINSNNKALLTILMSSNFVEIKAMVFKKFAPANLYTMSCGDVRERFHIFMLLIVSVLNTMKEYDWSDEHFWILVPDCTLIFFAEFLVDWVKHCFVTRLNNIKYEVYRTYTVTMACDLTSTKLKTAYADHTDTLSRKIGLIPIPISLLIVCTIYRCIPIYGWYGYSALLLGFLCLLTMKCWLHIFLLGWSFDMIEKYRQAQELKNAIVRHCKSLPSSRNSSLEDLKTVASKANQ